MEKFNLLCDTIVNLGLPLNKDKIESPNTTMVIMGIEIDTVRRTISIPPTKLDEIVQEVNAFDQKTYMYKRELQSLLGKLLYISKIVQLVRGFLNPMLQALRRMHGQRAKINTEFKKDLGWFRKFLQVFNGCTSFDNWTGESDNVCFIDASLQGLGAICDNQFYSVHLPNHIASGGPILVFEMLNVLVALKLWGMSGVTRE